MKRILACHVTIVVSKISPPTEGVTLSSPSLSAFDDDQDSQSNRSMQQDSPAMHYGLSVESDSRMPMHERIGCAPSFSHHGADVSMEVSLGATKDPSFQEIRDGPCFWRALRSVDSADVEVQALPVDCIVPGLQPAGQERLLVAPVSRVASAEATECGDLVRQPGRARPLLTYFCQRRRADRSKT